MPYSKIILYIAALLTGLVTGPVASAGTEKAQAAQQCAASVEADFSAGGWLAELAKPQPKPKAAVSVPKDKPAVKAKDPADCKTGDPVKRNDLARE